MKISSQLEEPSVQQFGSTGQNVADAAGVKTLVDDVLNITNRVRRSAKTTSVVSVEEYLARPVQIGSGSIGVGDGPTTFGTIAPITTILSREPASYKMRGRFLLRGNLHVKLQINSNRFHAGRYILALVMHGGAGSEVDQNKWVDMHRYSKVQITQLPHIELDLSKDTEAEMVIPYVSQHAGYVQSNNTVGKQFGDVGVLVFYPYHPLVTVAGSSTAPFFIWAWITEAELDGAAIPQGGWEYQGGDPIAEEQKAGGIGPIQSSLIKVSQSMGILNAVPILSSITSTTAWAADILANVASVWGWSRPSNLAVTKRIVQAPGTFHACGDMADNSQPLSLSARNHVGVGAGFGGTDLDEMAIDYLKAIPTWFTTVTWADTAVMDDSLLLQKVSPTQFIVPYTDAGKTNFNYSTVAYLGTLFNQWRGTLIFRLKLVKTEFHSGRLLILFNPINTFMATGPTLD